MTAEGVTGGDPTKLDLSGGTMTGPIILPDASPAASRDWVTDHAGGGGGGGGSVESVNGVDPDGDGNVKLAAADLNAVADDDSRLTDARTPTAHAGTHAVDGDDEISPASIGAATASELGAHETDTTSVHGITDTAALETQSGATGKVSTHTAASDPHGDRAFTASAVATHTAASDPHGDRAFATSAIADHTGAVDPHGDRAYAAAQAATALTSAGGYTDTAIGGVNTTLAGKADLVGGKLDQSQLPDLAIVQYLGTSANQAAMLALSGQQGDWTIRTDLGTVWWITGSNPTILGNWTQAAYPTAPVISVAGKTGAVSLAQGDVGLGNVDDTADASKAFAGAQITTGTVAYARLPVGTTTSTVAAGDDARLTDTRTPTDSTVTSAKIVDGTIVNADISAAAGIALSKLGTDPLARANHTGTQLAATISDFAAAVAALYPAFTPMTLGTSVTSPTITAGHRKEPGGWTALEGIILAGAAIGSGTTLVTITDATARPGADRNFLVRTKGNGTSNLLTIKADGTVTFGGTFTNAGTPDTIDLGNIRVQHV